MASINIYSRRCWIGGQLIPATIQIKEGKIISLMIDIKMKGDGTFIDAGRDIVMPGVIDAHVHINEPGRTEWEGFKTATKAAAAGGSTSLIEMPLNSDPVVTSLESLHKKIASTTGKLKVNCGFYGGLVPGNKGEISALIENGVFGIKSFLIDSGLDEFQSISIKELDEAMAISKNQNIQYLFHCEINDNSGPAENFKKNPKSYKAYLESRPNGWEDKAIESIINLCKKHKTKCHIVHLSSSDSISSIYRAKENNIDITVETCPHYLLFNAEEIPDGDTRYKCAPPIRSKENNDRLKKAVKDGIIDFIGSDHSPAPPEIKEYQTGNFLNAWGGISGLQFLLSGAWTALKETIAIEQFIPLLTENPAKFLGLSTKGFLKPGFDADIVIWDPKKSETVTEKKVFHKHKESPYLGLNLFGLVKRTIVSGEIVYDNGKFNDLDVGKVLLSYE